MAANPVHTLRLALRTTRDLEDIARQVEKEVDYNEGEGDTPTIRTYYDFWM